MQRDVMTYDVLIIGAGPAGLSAAIRLKQLARDKHREISVCVLEKGARIGAHSVSGAVIDPIALDELLPDWRNLGAPITTAVKEDHLLVLDEDQSWRIPSPLLPKLMHNHGMVIASLGEVCLWLAEQAEAQGVEIYPGFAAAAMQYDDDGNVIGVICGDMGRNAQGNTGAQFSPGMELHAAYTLIAEGTRGSLCGELEQRFQLRQHASPQKYALGIKEIWRIDPARHQPGLVQHTLGWPLDNSTGGGGFMYHYGDQLLAIGMVVHLDYANPYLSPFEEFQQLKRHPSIRPLFTRAQRLSFGARAISEGGLQSLPDLVFPGGALIGCAAGMVNVPRIKGIHNAMKSAMLAAEAAYAACAAGRRHDRLDAYPAALRRSWVWRDLDTVRNIKPYLSRLGTLAGTLAGGSELWLAQCGLRMPWTLKHRHADHATLQPAAAATPMAYPAPDGEITFDRLSSIALSNQAHRHDQPCHLHLNDAALALKINLAQFAAPEQRYCPAGVYEMLEDHGAPRLQINAQNCIHCKICDIKDPMQNIVWMPPEGGSGPNYSSM